MFFLLFSSLGYSALSVVTSELLKVQDISIEQAKNDGWLYPPPDSGNGNPLDFVVRLYSINDISWKSIGSAYLACWRVQQESPVPNLHRIVENTWVHLATLNVTYSIKSGSRI